MYLELLQPLREQEERRLLTALKELDAMDKDQLLLGTLAIKAGLEAAGVHERHLLALVEEGENAQTQLIQLMEELELEK